MSTDEAIRMTRSMIQKRFREDYTIEAQHMLIQTMQEDLPSGPIMNKAFEGMAKNMPDDAIVQAMEKTRARYSYAYKTAGTITANRNNRNAIGDVIAQGMGAGMQEPDMDRIMTQLATRTRQMTRDDAEALALQTCLAARVMARMGVESENVSDVMSKALQNRYTAGEMQQLANRFKNQSQEMEANRLANAYAHGIEAGERVGNLGAQSGSSSGGGSGSGSGSQGSGGSGGSSGGSGSAEGNSGGSGNAGGSGGSAGSSGGSGNSDSGSGSSGSSGASGSEGGSGGSSGGSGKGK
jgi:hypothetical protein